MLITRCESHHNTAILLCSASFNTFINMVQRQQFAMISSTASPSDLSQDERKYREKYLKERKENRRLQQQIARLQQQLNGRPSSVIADEINAFEQSEEYQWNTARSPPGSVVSYGSMSPGAEMMLGSPHIEHVMGGGDTAVGLFGAVDAGFTRMSVGVLPVAPEVVEQTMTTLEPTALGGIDSRRSSTGDLTKQLYAFE